MEDHIQFFDGPSEVSFRQEGPLLHHFRSTSITKDQELLEVGKNEEQLPQPTVGRLSANGRPTVGQQPADSWPTVDRLSFTAFYENLLPTVGQLLAVCRPTVGSMSVICWQHVGRVSADCWPTVRRLVENPCQIPEKP